MKTTKSILNVLRINYLLYDNFREACFLNWSKKIARNQAISLKALVVHDGLRNWYQDQWLQLVENQFIKENQDFFDLDQTEAMQDIFFEYPERIENFYPQPLLEIIKKESHGLNERTDRRASTTA